VSDHLPDPCPTCGFDGRSLRPLDILATLRSLGRRWAGALADAPSPAARAHAEAALDGLLAAARPIRAEVGRFDTRPEADAAGLATATEAIADALEGPDEPFQRDGVREAARAAAHAGIHHLRLAEKGS
jgi:hypothetical protein